MLISPPTTSPLPERERDIDERERESERERDLSYDIHCAVSVSDEMSASNLDKTKIDQRERER